MKTLIIALLLFCSFSCNSGKITQTIVIHDTLYKSPVIVDSFRYFMIAYHVTSKDRRQTSYGSRWLDVKGFPSKKWIDSIVYTALPLQKSCYQSIIVTSIFEFKNHEDFNSYLKDYKGDPNPKKQIQCQN